MSSIFRKDWKPKTERGLYLYFIVFKMMMIIWVYYRWILFVLVCSNSSTISELCSLNLTLKIKKKMLLKTLRYSFVGRKIVFNTSFDIGGELILPFYFKKGILRHYKKCPAYNHRREQNRNLKEKLCSRPDSADFSGHSAHLQRHSVWVATSGMTSSLPRLYLQHGRAPPTPIPMTIP